MVALTATRNPFDVTKATDFTDDQIEQTWVDLPGGMDAFIDPSTSMPRFLVGGKGGGRTHLMRYQSYKLQVLRARGHAFDGVRASSYLGVYFRCTGLNANRFGGKGQSGETWDALFAYYMDIWLARLALEVVEDLLRTAPGRVVESDLQAAADDIRTLFDAEIPPAKAGASAIQGLISSFKELQRTIDVAVNNAAISRTLTIALLSSPGELVFGVPACLVRHVRELSELRFIYLLDEFENLSAAQQRYVNTLVREKQPPSTFVIGSRLLGIRSHETLSAGEENKAGSEYDLIRLEDVYRESNAQYIKFCRSVVVRRLGEVGLERKAEELDALFATEPIDLGTSSTWASDLVARWDPLERPYFAKLRKKLHEHSRLNDHQIDGMVKSLAILESPMLEKFALLEFYRAWARSGSPGVEAAEVAGSTARTLANRATAGKRLLESYESYAPDLAAQLARDCQTGINYSGLPTFIRMSGYLPRNLLVILKQVTRWAFFQGEDPYRSNEPISLSAQQEGIREAADWFWDDSRALGRLGEDTHSGVGNLGSFLRSYRFSDKPAEISVSTISVNRADASRGALKCIDAALSQSLLLEVRSGHHAKNSETLTSKYQINPMLAPKFGLPMVRRGVLMLKPEEVWAIFDPEAPTTDLRAVRRARLAPLNAPFKLETDLLEPQQTGDQDLLPGFGE